MISSLSSYSDLKNLFLFLISSSISLFNATSNSLFHALNSVASFFNLQYLNNGAGGDSDPLIPLESSTKHSASSLFEVVQEWCIDNGVYSDFLLRRGIRFLLNKRLVDLNIHYNVSNVETFTSRKHDFVQSLCQLPELAIHTDKANQQHYEVDTQFFSQCLGQNMKYSCCLYPNGNESLDQAEIAMLDLYTLRSELVNGHSILDLGCGWGSLSLFLAQKYPLSKVTGISNSKTQKQYIDLQAAKRNIKNLTILTADINVWSTTEKFDRVLSIEMFEHVKNYGTIMHLIHSVLQPNGKFFLHMFVHKDKPYHFQTKEANSWMARWFFQGGTMASFDLIPLYFQNLLALDQAWAINGTNYGKTSRQWLENMDNHRNKCMTLLKQCYGSDQCFAWWNRWRVFFIAVEELFAYKNGNEWFVGHYLFSRNK